MTEIYRDTPTTMALGLTGATNVSAVVMKDGQQVFSATGDTFNLPFSVYGVDGQFTVTWTFTMDGAQYTRDETHEVVTPYVTLQEIKDALGVIPANITDAMLMRSERVVRKIIDAHVGRNFGKYAATVTVYGTGDDKLRLPDRLISFSALTGANIIPDLSYYSALGDGSYIGLTQPVIDNGDWVFTNVISAPDVYWTNGGFRQDYAYKITGVWGWNEVPVEVKEAALILINNDLCPDGEWRDRYIEDVSYADTTFAFNSVAFSGTGSVKADQLLSGFVSWNMTVI